MRINYEMYLLWYENEVTSDFCSNCGKKLQETVDNNQANFNQTAGQINFQCTDGWL